MKLKFLFFFCLFLAACSTEQTSPHVKIIDSIASQFIKAMRLEGFQPYGYGGRMPEKIHSVYLGFEFVGNFTVEEARKMIVVHAEKLLEMINSTTDVRPYLQQYPFQPENCVFNLSFIQKGGKVVDPPNIAYAGVIRDAIVYYIRDDEKKFLKKVYEEPYEEAYKIVFGHERGKDSKPSD